MNYSQQRISYPWGFRNDDAATLPAMSIAYITGLEFKDNEAILILGKPSTSFEPRLAITEPIDCAADGYGRCAITGIVPVLYDSGTPAFGEGWGVKPDQWTISNGFPGCTVFDLVDSTAKIALVSLDSPVMTLFGKSSGTISARSGTTPGSGTMEIWRDVASVLANTTLEVTVKNLAATSIGTGVLLQAKLINGTYWVDFEECA